MQLYKWDAVGDKEAELALSRWINVESKIDALSFGKGIIALFDDGAWSWTEVTKLLDNKLRGRQRTLPRPTYVCIDMDKNYYIHFADGKCEWCGPPAFTEAIYNNKSPVSKVAFAPRGGWYILFQDGSSLWNSLPQSLHKMLKRHLSKRIKEISISPDGRWFVSFCNDTWKADLSAPCRRAIDTLLRECSPKIDHIWLGKKDAFCIRYEVYGKLKHLSPWEISFSETSVPAHFENDFSLWKAISDLEKNVLDSTTFSPIRVVRKDKQWVSLDNRRLFVFQNASISSIPVIAFDTALQNIKLYRSVNVQRCNCKQCDYEQDTNTAGSLGKHEEINNDAWARSWSWLLFLTEKNPPSALLLADSLVLPSVQHFNRTLPKYIPSVGLTTVKELRKENSISPRGIAIN